MIKNKNRKVPETVVANELSDGIIRVDVEKAKKDLSQIIGIGPATQKRLIEAGYSNTIKLASTPFVELTEISGIGEKNAKKIVTSARSIHKSTNVIRGSEQFESQKNIFRITTGSKAIDGLIGGGVEVGSITEFYGEFRTGKTQICNSLSVMAQLPVDRGGLDKGVFWIDTDGTWRARRIEEIATAVGLDPTEVLDRIYYCCPRNSEEQAFLTDEALEIVAQEEIGLIIIDSLMTHFDIEYHGHEIVKRYLAGINRQIGALKVAVVVTNQVIHDERLAFGNPNIPLGANAVAHRTTHRIALKKSFNNERIAELIDSPVYPPNKTRFLITHEGIRDVKSKEHLQEQEVFFT